MKYRQLGKTGLLVSEVGLGAEHLVHSTKEEIMEIVDEAMAKGVNIMDVFMPDYGVRSILGECLIGRRDKMLLQGHVGVSFETGQYQKTRDLATSKRSIEDFLTRFQTDYIDLAMLHYCDDLQDWRTCIDNGLIDYMKSQKEKGVFHYLGFSSHNPNVAMEMIRSDLFDCIMFSISPLFDLVLSDMNHFFQMPEDEAFPDHLTIDSNRSALYQLCEEKGVGITVMKALAAGSLLDAKESPFQQAMTVAQCIHYALNRPAVSSVLIGCKNPEEIRQAASYSELSEEEKDYKQVIANIQHGSQKKCMFCNHCLPCPQHLDIAQVSRCVEEVKAHGMSQQVKEDYKKLKVHAKQCIRCKACIQRCPFSIDVVTTMADAISLFGE